MYANNSLLLFQSYSIIIIRPHSYIVFRFASLKTHSFSFCNRRLIPPILAFVAHKTHRNSAGKTLGKIARQNIRILNNNTKNDNNNTHMVFFICEWETNVHSAFRERETNKTKLSINSSNRILRQPHSSRHGKRVDDNTTVAIVQTATQHATRNASICT